MKMAFKVANQRHCRRELLRKNWFVCFLLAYRCNDVVQNRWAQKQNFNLYIESKLVWVILKERQQQVKFAICYLLSFLTWRSLEIWRSHAEIQRGLQFHLYQCLTPPGSAEWNEFVLVKLIGWRPSPVMYCLDRLTLLMSCLISSGERRVSSVSPVRQFTSFSRSLESSVPSSSKSEEYENSIYQVFV